MKTKMLNLFLLFLVLALMGACNGIGTAEFKDATAGGTPGDGSNSTLSFSGITSTTGKTDSTITLQWTAHADAVAYDVYSIVSGNPVLVSSAWGQATSQIKLMGLTPSESYKFRVRMKNSSGQYDTNTIDVAVTMNDKPDMPTPALQSPLSSPAFPAKPTIRVTNVKVGDIITLYSDAGCSNLIGTKTADSTNMVNDSTIDIVTDPLAVGLYAITAKATNPNHPTVISDCSSTPVAYEKQSCPNDKGEYVEVPGNATLGTSDFCLAKYEMKNVSGAARSQATGTLWVNINQANSKIACKSLGAKYTLISNPEWMTVARDIEQVDLNWSSGTAGTGELNRGWSASTSYGDSYNHTVNAPSTGAACLYHSASNTCATTGNHRTKRTHALSRGGEIWDFAGNVWEWVDWQITVTPTSAKAYASTDGNTVTVYRDWSVIDTKIGPTDEMNPSTWASAFIDFDSSGSPVPATSLNRTNGLGLYYSGISYTGGAAVRGGAWYDGQGAGAFSLGLNIEASYTNAAFGFRCVYRP